SRIGLYSISTPATSARRAKSPRWREGPCRQTSQRRKAGSRNQSSRRARVQAYQDLLGTEERLEFIPHRTGSACLTQVIRLLPKHRGNHLAAHLIQVLGSAGYEVQGSYVPIHLLSHYEPWARERLPRAERVWVDLIELPFEPEVSFDHVERIASIVKRVLNS